MKNFREFVTELYRPSTFFGSGLSSHKVPYDVTDGDVRNTINAILGHTAVSEFLNPKAAIGQVESKLAQIGINRTQRSLDDPSDEVQEETFEGKGEIVMSFSQFGEIIGKSVDTPIDELDLEERTIDVKFKYEQLDNGTFKVYGSLV